MTTPDDPKNRNLTLIGMTTPDDSRNLPRWSVMTHRSLWLLGTLSFLMGLVHATIGATVPVNGLTMALPWMWIAMLSFWVAAVVREQSKRLRRLEEQVAQGHPRP
jgi:H+/Cl- antiporter ClcA